MHRLKESSKDSEFEKLRIKDVTTENELILLRLIEGRQDSWHKHKIVERLQISNRNLEAIIKVLQLESIKNFNQEKVYQATYIRSQFVNKCKFWDKEHERNKKKCSALRKYVRNT